MRLWKHVREFWQSTFKNVLKICIVGQINNAMAQTKEPDLLCVDSLKPGQV